MRAIVEYAGSMGEFSAERHVTSICTYETAPAIMNVDALGTGRGAMRCMQWSRRRSRDRCGRLVRSRRAVLDVRRVSHERWRGVRSGHRLAEPGCAPAG